MRTFDRRSLRVMAVGFGSYFSHGAITQGLPSLGVVIQNVDHFTLVQMGFVLGASSIGNLVALLVWAALVQRFGERLVIVIGLTGAGACLFAVRDAASYPQLLAGLMSTGLFTAAVPAATSSALGRTFSRRSFGAAFGIRQMGAPIGGAVASFVLPVAALRGGLGLAFQILSLSCITMAAICAVLLPPRGTSAPRPASSPSALRSPDLWRAALAGFLVVSVQSTLIAFTTLFLSSGHGWTVGAAAAVLATIQMAGAVARVVVGSASDRAPFRNLVLLRLVAAAGIALGLAALLSFTNSSLFIVLFVLAGILSVSSSSLVGALAADVLDPERSSAGFGIVNTASFGAAAIGPPIFSHVVTGTGWTAGWALLAVVAALAFVPLHRPFSRRSPTTAPAMAANSVSPTGRL